MRQQLTDLRAAMAEAGIAWYLVPTDDFHSSEYVGDYFKGRTYLSGFTGSAGTPLVGMDWAGLWTDGRYFLQAAEQLRDSGIELMRMGEKDVPTLTEYVKEHVRQSLGFDGRTVNVRLYRELEDAVRASGASIESGIDLVDRVWSDRPALSAEKAFELPLEVCGRSRAEKLRDVRASLGKNGADVLVMSSLMDVNWLLNIRGADVECTPVVLSFALVTQSECRLYINAATLDDALRASLEQDGVTICRYDAVYGDVKAIPAGSRLQMNLGVVNASLLRSVPEGVEVVDLPDPTNLPKAAKNEVEVANMRLAHVKDGVAVTRLMYYLKHNAGKVPMTEISVAETLEGFRREQEHYLGPSFSPIIAWGPHGAIVHYSATEETNIPVQPSSFLLADTGGHYLEGTTDITRTFAMGETTDEEKKLYTLVLKGHLRLGAARFRKGVTGQNLDYLAREALWQEGLDYNHGTGHGVGYLLSVHEGPQGIHWARKNATPFEAGMITSDEPGIYLEGKFGVRLENLVVCVDAGTTEYGQFLKFEYLTMVPWDLDAVVPGMLSSEERAWLNDYHAQVRDTLLPLLPEEERDWLRYATRAI